MVSFAIVLMLESRLGLSPWDVLHLGVSNHTPLSLGTATMVVGIIVIVIAWLAGASPGLGTIANVLVIGFSIDLLLSIKAIDDLSRSMLPIRIGLLAVSVLAFSFGLALYIAAGFGAGPRDSLMLALSRRMGIRIGLVRNALEVLALVTGVLLGGIAGIGTLAMALLVGPLVELAFWCLLKLGLATPGLEATSSLAPLISSE